MRLLPLVATFLCLFFPGKNGLHATSYTYTNSSELSKQKRQQVDSLKRKLGSVLSDSLRATHLEKIAKLYYHLNADSSIIYRRKAIEFCKISGRKGCWEENTHKLAILLINNGKLYEAEQYLKEVQEYSLAIGNKNRYGSTLIHLAWLRNKQGLLGESLQLYLQALEVKESINNWQGQSDIYNRLGLLYLEWLSPRRALISFEKAITIGRNNNKKGMYTAALYNAARSYMMTGEQKKAAEYYQEYIEMRMQQNSVHSLGYIFAAKAQMAQINKHTELEQQLLDSAIYHFNKLHLYPGAANCLLRKASIYLSNNKTTKAIQLADKALAIATASTHHRTMVKAHKTLAEAFSQHQLFEQAYYHNRLHESLQDSFYNGAASEQLFVMEDYFQKKQKEQAVALLQTNNELTQLKLKENQTRQLFLFILLSLALLVIGLVVHQLRQKHRSNHFLRQAKVEAEEALEEKGFLVKEIHHRVKNNLQVVSSLLRLQTKYIDDESALQAIEEGRNRVRSMSLIHQYLYQEDHPQHIQLQEYVDQLTRSLFRSYNIEPERIRLHLDIQANPLDIDMAINIGLMINELITNALKYAFLPEQNGKIFVQLINRGVELELSVKDNGIGTSVHQVKVNDGFGYQLLRALCKRMKAEMQVIQESGTAVHIRIPIFTALDLENYREKNLQNF